MAKQAKVKLTPVQQWEGEVRKWAERREDAIRALVRASDWLGHSQRRLARAKKNEAQTKVQVTVPVAGTGLTPGAAPGTTVDLDIPTFLLRKPDKTQDELRAAQQGAKEAKRKAQAARRKAIRAETQAHDKIPTSKRRWDVGKAMWISD